MIILFNDDNFLYVRCLLDLRKPIEYQNKVFEKGKHESMLLPEEVSRILTVNGNIKIWNGKTFVKYNLGRFNDILRNKSYKVMEMEKPEKEVKQIEPVKKVEVKPAVQPKEQAKVEDKEESKPVVENKVVEPVVPNPQSANDADNKKKRHKNNQQGGEDK